MDLQALILVALVNRHQLSPARNDEEDYYQQMGKEVWFIHGTLTAVMALAGLFHRVRRLGALTEPHWPKRKVVTG